MGGPPDKSSANNRISFTNNNGGLGDNLRNLPFDGNSAPNTASGASGADNQAGVLTSSNGFRKSKDIDSKKQ